MLLLIFTPAGVVQLPNLVSATPGDGKVTLLWDAFPGAVTYNVYRGTVSGGEVLYASGVVGLTYLDNGAVNGTTYWYEITAVVGGVESGLSNELSATPVAPPPAVLATPAVKGLVESEGASGGYLVPAEWMGVKAEWRPASQSSGEIVLEELLASLAEEERRRRRRMYKKETAALAMMLLED